MQNDRVRQSFKPLVRWRTDWFGRLGRYHASSSFCKQAVLLCRPLLVPVHALADNQPLSWSELLETRDFLLGLVWHHQVLTPLHTPLVVVPLSNKDELTCYRNSFLNYLIFFDDFYWFKNCPMVRKVEIRPTGFSDKDSFQTRITCAASDILG